MPQRKIAVTGAHGYVGSLLVRAFGEAGWRVVPLTRDPAAGEVRFTLEDGPAPGGLDGVEALVHCAWDFGPRQAADAARVNAGGARRLLLAATAAGVRRLVNISTLSAFPGARSVYGATKLEVEALFAQHGGLTIRPGLVHGQDAGGMIGTLDRVAARLPIVPVFAARRPLHTVHEADLARVVLAAASGELGEPGEVIVAAERQTVRLPDVVRGLARARGRRVAVLPVPWWLVWAGLRTVETVRPLPGLRSDSVLSLATLEEPDGRLWPPADRFTFRPLVGAGAA